MRQLLALLLFVSTVQSECKRIVSLAPSLTEIVYELGLSDNLIAVDRYSNYPKDVQNKLHLGGYLDLNFEHLYGLQPDALFALQAGGLRVDLLRDLKIPYHLYSHRDVQGILDSIRLIGQVCKIEDKSSKLIQGLQSKIDSFRAASAKRKIEALIIIAPAGKRELKDFYLSGSDGIYTELLEIAGGENIVQSRTAALPSFSTETLLVLNPEVIVEISSNPNDISAVALMRPWAGLEQISAVKNQQVFRLNADYATIPGPRIFNLLEDFQGIIQNAAANSYP